MTISGDIYVLV